MRWLARGAGDAAHSSLVGGRAASSRRTSRAPRGFTDFEVEG
jgi:hypothetical protein